ncbi:hypothetical protein, partial [Kocuria marina]|uniref:hypothetical protein n=1 Tax=Kocuria marina TaxID=223184 RepID=UPI0022E151B8
MTFLLDAYRKLIDASERDTLSSERRDNLEGALADVMLLGGQEEIQAAGRFQRVKGQWDIPVGGHGGSLLTD